MSGIFGLVRLDNASVQESDLDRMREAMAHYGRPDGAALYVDGPAGLGQLSSDPRLDATGSSRIRRVGPSALAAAARLDNRGDLRRTLRGSSLSDENSADLDLVAEALLRWDSEAPGRLYGDWQFGRWNPRARSLLLARDHFGNTGLFYYNGPTVFAFASSMRALLALDVVPKVPDLRRVAEILAVVPGEDFRTPYEGIRYLPGAHALLLEDQRLRVWRYWRPEQAPTVSYSRQEDYWEAFRDQVRRAVACRVEGGRNIGATLSSGLDSATVVTTAGPLLAQDGRRLRTFTAVPAHPPEGLPPFQLGNEWELAAVTAQASGPNIDHESVDGTGTTFLDSIFAQVDLLDGPTHAASNFHWLLEILRRARVHGLDVLLTGQHGNGTVSWTGHGSILPYIRAGDLTGSLRRLFNAELTVYQALRRGLVKPAYHALKHQAGKTLGVAQCRWRTYSAIGRGLEDTVSLAQSMRAMGHDPTFSKSALGDLRSRLFAPDRTWVGSLWHEIGARHGIDILDPTMDQQLAEFCLGLPDEQFYFRGERKRLLRRAFRGIIPDEILFTPFKGIQGADTCLRVRSERAQFLAALDRLESSPLARHCLDLARMRSAIPIPGQPITADSIASCNSILVRGLSVGLFLLRF